MRDTRRAWIWFLSWAAVGAGGVTALLTVLTVGPYVAVLTLVAAVLLGRVPRSHGGLPGLVAGAGVLPLVVAWLNRSGPGNVCSGNACTEEWSPWPWLAAGVVLLAVGTAIWARRGANSRTGPRPW
ncbi:hypothetical protein [Streptacidiphilus neutrinimicus]|uniref:hypothetical protein n=1 Tax=Streptacidiphilus neutrinimicus TaxID=105420 RepID=UPI0005A961F5|nr:hypothetical protein [Streptacidiphilus neutrinimicus]